MTLTLEHKVFGSLTNEQGDGVLSYTSGVSKAADNFGALLTATANAPLSAEYASLFLLPNPDNGLLTLLHVQGSYQVFAGMARAYDTRAVYELTADEFARTGSRYAPIVEALHAMHPYDKREYGTQNQVQITSVSATPSPLEQRIRSYIVHALMTGRQLFVKLGQDEDLKADNVRHSRKLKALLGAIDSLPEAIRRYASMGFSVDSRSAAVHTLADYLLVVAHHDDIVQWGSAPLKAMMLNWEGENLEVVNAQEATQDEEQRLVSVSPLVKEFLGNAPIKRAMVSNLLSIIPQNIDKVLAAPNATPSDNDKRILQAVLQSAPSSYRHSEASERVLTLATHGHAFSFESIGLVLQYYPHLRNYPDLDTCIDKLLYKCDTSVKLAKLYDYLHLCSSMHRKALEWIFKYPVLLNGMPQVADTAMGRDLRASIVQNVKRVRNSWKVEHIDEPYFELSPEDIELTDWYTFAQVAKALESKPNGKQQLAGVKTDAAKWGVEKMDMPLYQRVKRYMTLPDLFCMLDAAIKANNSTLYCGIVDDLLAAKNTASETLRDKQHLHFLQIYIVYVTKREMLSKVRPEAFGLDCHVLDASLLDLLYKNGNFRQNFLVDAIQTFDRHKRLTPEVQQTFVDLIVKLLPHPTLVQVITCYNQFAKLLPTYFTRERFVFTTQLGNREAWQQGLKQMKKNGAPKELLDLANDHGHDILLEGCPKTFDQLLAELNQKPLEEQHFFAIEGPNDVLLLCSNLTIEDFLKLYRLAARRKEELKKIGKWKHFEAAFAAYGQEQLREWFQTKDVTKSLYIREVAPLRGDDPKLFVLMQMRQLQEDELLDLESKFTAFVSKNPRDKEAYDQARKYLQLPINALVDALKHRHLLAEDSPLVAAATKRGFGPKHTVKRSTLKWTMIATCAIVLLAIIGTAIVFEMPVRDKGPASGGVDTVHIKDSLQKDSLLRDSLQKDSLLKDSLRKDSLKKDSVRIDSTRKNK